MFAKVFIGRQMLEYSSVNISKSNLRLTNSLTRQYQLLFGYSTLTAYIRTSDFQPYSLSEKTKLICFEAAKHKWGYRRTQRIQI